MTKQQTDPLDQETIVVLPANELSTFVMLAPGHVQGMHPQNGGRTSAAPIGRDEPFPCFKKEIWEEQGIARIVQDNPSL